MFDHFGFIVADAERAFSFYSAALAPLGFAILQRQPDGGFVVGSTERPNFMHIGPRRPDYWREGHVAGASPFHLCLAASSREAVASFHAAALDAGGTDNGAPGERHPGYYAAFALDPDGNNIEAACRAI